MTAGNGPVDIYARVSRRGEKEQRSIDGQVQVCKAILTKRGLPMGEIHVDDGRSAWNPSVRRKGWTRLMERLETGEAGGVIVFDLERFSRQPDDGSRLITIAGKRGLLVLDSDGEFDLTSASGKKNFRDAMNAAAYYSDRLSDRTKRGKKLKALTGEPNGRVTKDRGPFGFMPDGATPRLEEAEILCDLVRRFLSGETQDSLIRDLNDRGITTTYGKPWTRAGLRQVLTRPLNAGLVEYHGTVLGKLAGEPVISPEDYARVLAVYASRRPARPPSGRYLCAGMVVCGLCGKPLAGRPRINVKHYADDQVRREYWCSPSAFGGCGRIAIDQRALDEYAKKLSIAWLSHAETALAVEVAAAEAEAEASELDDEISYVEALRAKLMDRLIRGELDEDEWEAARTPLAMRLTSLRERRASLGVHVAQVPVDSEDVWRGRWDAAQPDERREMLKLALRGRHLIVHPADQRCRTDVAARTTISIAVTLRPTSTSDSGNTRI